MGRDTGKGDYRVARPYETQVKDLPGYRKNHERAFGKNKGPRYCAGCGLLPSWCECEASDGSR